MSGINHAEANVLVCQRGARHRYAIPQLLQEEGLLSALYTDSTSYSSAGRLARALHRFGITSSRFQALISRKPEGIPRKKIFCSDKLLHSSFAMGLLPHDLSPVFKRWGLRGANVVYSMCGEDFAFLEWAKGQGAKILIDVFIHPGTARIINEESMALTGKPSDDNLSVEDFEEHFLKSFELADLLLCPSSWVASGVRAYAPEHAEKIRIVPYGSSLTLRESITAEPVSGRVLFAGREALRKGIHHLAAAVAEVKKRGLEIDARLAGMNIEDVAWVEHHEVLNCLGTLPMDRMHQEFETADVFVLPSLSEGQAGVLLEAMASGCPVIATEESGVDFKPDCGILIPRGNVKALADAIESVVRDRAFRNKLANGALKQAQEFSMASWKERLAGVVNEAVRL